MKLKKDRASVQDALERQISEAKSMIAEFQSKDTAGLNAYTGARTKWKNETSALLTSLFADDLQKAFREAGQVSLIVATNAREKAQNMKNSQEAQTVFLESLIEQLEEDPAPVDSVKGLKMKTSCEKCGAGLRLTSEAFICSYECTFCAKCSDRMDEVCPNCSGELVRRPKRTSK